MNQADLDSLQSIGCVPWGAGNDFEFPQEAADYYCPEFGLDLRSWGGFDDPYFNTQETEVSFPDLYEAPVSDAPVEQPVENDSGGYTVQIDVSAPDITDVPMEPSIDVPMVVVPLPLEPVFETSVIPVLIEPPVFSAPAITIDTYAPDVIEGKPLYAEKPFEEKPMEIIDSLFATPAPAQIGPNIVGGVVGALAGEAIQDLKSYFSPTPTYITGGTLVGPTQTGLQVKGRMCKISRAKNPKNPHYGKPVCNRMNPLNPKALARAVRRLAGFQHFATRTEKAIQHSFRKAGIHPTRRIGGKCGTCNKARCSCR